jgi:hypothetical protein
MLRPVTADRVREVSRRLRDAAEPLAASVYFAPEPREAYAELGVTSYGAGYFCSRSAPMGRLTGAAVAAVFAVFAPALVERAVTKGWSITEPAPLLAARERGAIAALRRMLGDRPGGAERATALLRRAAEAAPLAGRPLFAGLRGLGWPGDPVGDLWRAADLVREHRGDGHVHAWTAAGVDAVEITVLTELWWGVPVGSYAPTRGWSTAEVDAAAARLRDRGLAGDGGFTDEGRALRASIEDATDRGERTLVDALGDDADEVLALLEPLAATVVEAGGYPVHPSAVSRR